jgi:hypothetical protein
MIFNDISETVLRDDYVKGISKFNDPGYAEEDTCKYCIQVYTSKDNGRPRRLLGYKNKEERDRDYNEIKNNWVGLGRA